MFDDFLTRVRDPRVRRPMIGLVISYLAWVGISYLAGRSGLARGSELERLITIGLMMLPILGMAAFLAWIYRRADEVERAMYGTAAAWGFVVAMLAGLLGMHLEWLDTELQLAATHIWLAGMLAWLLGLWRSVRSLQ